MKNSYDRTGPRPSYKNHIENLIQLYVVENKPIYEVASITGLNEMTVSNWLKKADIEIVKSQDRRTPEQQAAINQKISESKSGTTWSEPARAKIMSSRNEYSQSLWEDRICPECGNNFHVRSRTGQKYCSTQCSGNAKSGFYVCPCGKEIKHYQKYCSSEHRKEYGSYKAPGTPQVAICLGCGEEFQRPKGYAGKLKYCSNKCSHQERKFGWSKHALEMDQGILIFRSKYELRFFACCERFSIPCRSYDGPDIQTSLGIYRPDFIVTNMNHDLIIEVKGWDDPESATKVREAREQGFNICLVNKESLIAFENNEIYPWISHSNPGLTITH